MTHGDERRELRLWGTFVGWLGLWSLVLGCLSAIQVGSALEPFSGIEYASRVLALSAVREYSSGVCSGAVCIALVIWAHGAAGSDTRARLTRSVPRVCAAGLLGQPACVALFLASASVTLALFGVDWLEFWLPVLRMLEWSDLGAGLVATALQLAVVVALSWAALPWLGEQRWRLWSKALIAWVAAGVLASVLFWLRELVPDLV